MDLTPQRFEAKAAPGRCLLDDVWLRALEMHRDDRGFVTEVFRDSWGLGPRPVQWNLVRTEPGVVRGVHVHLARHDLLAVVHGRATLGLCDLRRSSSTWRRRLLVEMKGHELNAVTIPPGVVHGFYSHEESLLACAFSEAWDPADDFGCHWADVDLAIPWPNPGARCSEKDAQLPGFAPLIARLPDWLG